MREAMPVFGRQIAGYDHPDVVMTGVETRTSSPVRFTRGDDLQSLNTAGLFPAGEGAGYAGGILSAAVDGIRVGGGGGAHGAVRRAHDADRCSTSRTACSASSPIAASPTPRATLSDFIDLPGVYPAGRLDRDSEGLLLLTDDGRLQARIADPQIQAAQDLSRPGRGRARRRRARRAARRRDAQRRPDPPGRGRARSTDPALWPRDPPIRVRTTIPDRWLRLTIREGRNRQVRRMTAAVGHPTLRLVRWRDRRLDARRPRAGRVAARCEDLLRRRLSPGSGWRPRWSSAGRSEIARDLGPGTSMDAEWLALIDGDARRARDLCLVDALLLGDAAAVIAQANGAAQCPPDCARYLETFRALPRPPGRVRLRWIKRTQNLAGIALARTPI